MLTFVIIGITGAIAAITVKKNSPEIAVLLSLVTGAAVLFAFIREFAVIKSYIESIVKASKLPGEELGTLLKVTGAAILTRISAELCRDAGEGAIAAKIEIAGAAVCIVLSLPLFSALAALAVSLV